MPTFKDDSILIIAPGSHTTLAQLGLPESFTPARRRFKSRMFPAETAGEWEPHKIRTKTVKKQENGQNGSTTESIKEPEEGQDITTFEEDQFSDEGAVWPMKAGRIINWTCFYALMEHIHRELNTPFHTAVLVVAQPVWTPREHEKITQFFFERFKIPAFALIDAAQASCSAFGLDTACIVDVGADKADVTAVVDFLIDHIGRSKAVPDCGGESMTRKLLDLLATKGFTREMCEQLKKSSICEVLPPDVPLPGSAIPQNGTAGNPASLASTGAQGSGPDQRLTAASAGEVPRGPGENTDVGEEDKDLEDNDGVLDVASIVTGGKMNEYLERKEKEKAEKIATKNKKAGETGAAPPKPVKMRNSEKERNTFFYEDHALLDALKGSNMDREGVAEARVALDEGPQKATGVASEPSSAIDKDSSTFSNSNHAPRRELSVGTERFMAVSEEILTTLSSAIYRTILSHPQSNKRSDLWSNLVIIGSGAGIRGFKEALLATLNSRYLISPSSATMFTSELPSNFSTPVATGANTPTHPHPHSHGGHGSGVNPLLLAATHAQPQMSASGHLHPPSSVQQQTPQVHRDVHSAHGQTPTSIKIARLPEYFQEWKDIGSEEAAFLGAQVAAKVIFVIDQDQRNKGFVTRPEWNESGPVGIHEFAI